MALPPPKIGFVIGFVPPTLTRRLDSNWVRFAIPPPITPIRPFSAPNRPPAPQPSPISGGTNPTDFREFDFPNPLSFPDFHRHFHDGLVGFVSQKVPLFAVVPRTRARSSLIPHPSSSFPSPPSLSLTVYHYSDSVSNRNITPPLPLYQREDPTLPYLPAVRFSEQKLGRVSTLQHLICRLGTTS
jgi:hypothetical protein